MRSSDADLFDLMRKRLFPAVIGDILDVMGFRHQFLSSSIKPVRPDMVVLGRAMPVLEADCQDDGKVPPTEAFNARNPDALSQPFGLLFEALDDLKPNEVYVASGCSARFALWGGLMTARARHLEAAGAVLDGAWRDTPEVLASGLPVFGTCSYAQDQGARGKVLNWRVPLQVNGVNVRPGDIVFGDLDGVLVIPQAAEKEAITRALEKASTESAVRKAIDAGMSTAEAFRTFGVM
jgi:4-hydroxy-4-methyl-2-oxoglutarate aldolase